MLVGTEANRPAAGTVGEAYYATDTKLLYIDDGAAWNQVGPFIRNSSNLAAVNPSDVGQAAGWSAPDGYNATLFGGDVLSFGIGGSAIVSGTNAGSQANAGAGGGSVDLFGGQGKTYGSGGYARLAGGIGGDDSGIGGPVYISGGLGGNGNGDGGDVTISGGSGLGTGRSGDVIISTGNPVHQRAIIRSKPIALTSGSPVGIIDVWPYADTVSAGTIFLTVISGDGTDVQVARAEFMYVGVNKGGTVTSQVVKVADVTEKTTGSLTIAADTVDATSQFTIRVTATASGITPSTLNVIFTVLNDCENDVYPR